MVYLHIPNIITRILVRGNEDKSEKEQEAFSQKRERERERAGDGLHCLFEYEERDHKAKMQNLEKQVNYSSIEPTKRNQFCIKVDF